MFFHGNRNYYNNLKLQETLWRTIITQGMNYNCNHGDYCHDNSSEELVHTLPIIDGDGPTVNMEMSLMNQSEDDDHSGGQEETRGSRLCCVM